MFPGWRGVAAADPGLRCATASRLIEIPQFLPANRRIIRLDSARERVHLLPVDFHSILVYWHRGTALGRIKQRLDEQHFFRGIDDYELTLVGEDGPAEGLFFRA